MIAMPPGSYKVYKVQADDIFLLSDFSTIGFRWPDTVSYGNKSYKFLSNEPIDGWMASHYSGHARYTKVKSA